MGGTGGACDTTLAETVIGPFKTEVIQRRGPWRSPEMVESAAPVPVHRVDMRRLLEPLGHVPPAEHEERYHEQAKAGRLARPALR